MKIASGGQTGVDRSALDVALALGLPCTGWVPKGGLAGDFPRAPGLLRKYPFLRETGTSDPAERTRLNVRDSEATLILFAGAADIGSVGTRLTLETARRLGRPFLVLRADDPHAPVSIRHWLFSLGEINVLNIAGPRESEAPGIYELAYKVLDAALASLSAP